MTPKPKKLIYTNREMPQGTDSWRKDFRGWGLGGSDVACLMFAAYRQTINGLWEEKIAMKRGAHVDKDWNEIMERGNRLEPAARAHYESGRYSVWNYKSCSWDPVKVTPCKVDQFCAINPELEIARTSLDGIQRNRRVILEIKSPKDKINHERFTKDGIIPTWRYPQVQYMIGVMKPHFPQVERVDYISYLVEEEKPKLRMFCEKGKLVAREVIKKNPKVLNVDMRVIPIAPDWKYINEVFRRAGIFMGYVDREERPPVKLFREGEKLIARVKPTAKATNVPMSL